MRKRISALMSGCALLLAPLAAQAQPTILTLPQSIVRTSSGLNLDYIPTFVISKDTNTGLPCLAGFSATCLLASGGGGGGAVTGAVGSFLDGWSLTAGTTGDPAWTGTGTATEIALLKAIAATVLSNAASPVTQSGTWTVQPGNTANTTPWIVQMVPGTTNALSGYHLLPIASDNHAVIKNGAGVVYTVDITSINTTYQNVRLYDAGTGFNGCNSAANLLWGALVPGQTTGAGIVKEWTIGRAFTSGLSICYTGAYGDTDTTAATVSVSDLNIGYK